MDEKQTAKQLANAKPPIDENYWSNIEERLRNSTQTDQELNTEASFEQLNNMDQNKSKVNKNLLTLAACIVVLTLVSVGTIFLLGNKDNGTNIDTAGIDSTPVENNVQNSKTTADELRNQESESESKDEEKIESKDEEKIEPQDEERTNQEIDSTETTYRSDNDIDISTVTTQIETFVSNDIISKELSPRSNRGGEAEYFTNFADLTVDMNNYRYRYIAFKYIGQNNWQKVLDTGESCNNKSFDFSYKDYDGETIMIVQYKQDLATGELIEVKNEQIKVNHNLLNRPETYYVNEPPRITTQNVGSYDKSQPRVIAPGSITFIADSSVEIVEARVDLFVITCNGKPFIERVELPEANGTVTSHTFDTVDLSNYSGELIQVETSQRRKPLPGEDGGFDGLVFDTSKTFFLVR